LAGPEPPASLLTRLIPARVTVAGVSFWLAAHSARLVLVINAIASVSNESDCQLCGSRFRG